MGAGAPFAARTAISPRWGSPTAAFTASSAVKAKSDYRSCAARPTATSGDSTSDRAGRINSPTKASTKSVWLSPPERQKKSSEYFPAWRTGFPGSRPSMPIFPSAGRVKSGRERRRRRIGRIDRAASVFFRLHRPMSGCYPAGRRPTGKRFSSGFRNLWGGRQRRGSISPGFPARRISPL